MAAMATHRQEPFGVRAGARTTQRRGRMSPGKATALVELAPRWMLDGAAGLGPARLDLAFGRRAPRLLDIGAGTGEATRHYAQGHPDQDVVAVELHRPGIVRLVRDLDRDGPATVRVIEADALAVIDQAEPESYHHIRVLFPDPWPKRRHVGRRMVDPAFVRAATDLLPIGGTLHLATDWADYADQMRACLRTDRRLGPTSEERPPRPITAYEQRGIDAGRAIVDLVAERVS